MSKPLKTIEELEKEITRLRNLLGRIANTPIDSDTSHDIQRMIEDARSA